MHSRSMAPQFRAISCLSYPWHNAKTISGFVQMYSTVGVRVPIWRRRMLLKICTASFFPSKSIRCRLRSSSNKRPELYISYKITKNLIDWRWLMLSKNFYIGYTNCDCIILPGSAGPEQYPIGCFLYSTKNEPEHLRYWNPSQITNSSYSATVLKDLPGPREQNFSLTRFKQWQFSKFGRKCHTFSCFLASWPPFSSVSRASFKFRTTSLGDFDDLPNSGMMGV